MVFVKTFKGYEDKVQELDQAVNGWIAGQKIDVLDVKSALSHEEGGGRAHSGDLIYTLLYRAEEPVA